MKFSIGIDDLLPALQSVIGVVEKRQTLSILSNILVNISSGKFAITGTDLEVEISTIIPLEDSSLTIDFTVPAKKLFDICKNLDHGILLNFELVDNKLILKAKKSRFTLITLSADNFPNLDPMSSTSEFSLSQRDLKFVIDSTQFSMANQDVRYYLNGLLFEIFNNELRSIATDGHRLAFSFVDSLTNLINISKDTTQQLIVHRKAITELNRLLSDSEDVISISISASHLNIVFKDLSFTTKLIDGRFPDYQRVIPSIELCTKNIIADRQVLKQSLSRIAVLSTEKYKAARLEFKQNHLVAVVHNPEQEEAEEHISIDYSGEEFTIGFNVGYLVDALNAVKEDQVTLSLTDSNSSCLISGLNNDSVKYVVMPMRL
ncbi:MAG: DNA polymerase III subunit beta [gamma proteobacterium symbiont of Bathyaustriella thionipta]|nr:DNA polymerase III subunit beta [gamma proteobacterium symbiont of Bathyaustriella thionipta]MCU7949386.1 DNA polymerase III subunit beta [gamma proteobacterium symbiont of Bathyaustriella thionipta]MCU7952522.1 DNA polymerase III subunit beta [gamma proteobacterium symbiont of Bathyaustriella thionipta]MCU7955970.1 DNA polymerase III subunit beta [gamma proteobacterium symbiont of Bathyaustriella thionipta]MCU7968431.1 DNA polymerase III subunit beta [gamma proteobacterium symbiont of Bathy